MGERRVSADHLLCHPDEAALLADLADRVVEGRLTGHVIAGVTVYLAEEVRGEPDPETGEAELITPAVTLPGRWTWISTTGGPDADLMARQSCRIVCDPDAAAASQPFVLMVRDPATALRVVRIEPTPTGRSYDFGSLPMIE